MMTILGWCSSIHISEFGTNNRWNRMRGTSVKTYSVSIWYSVLTIQRSIAIDPLGLCRQIQEWGQYTLLSSLGSRVLEDTKFKKSSTEQYFQTYPANLEQCWGQGGGGYLQYELYQSLGVLFNGKISHWRMYLEGKLPEWVINFHEISLDDLSINKLMSCTILQNQIVRHFSVTITYWPTQYFDNLMLWMIAQIEISG